MCSQHQFQISARQEFHGLSEIKCLLPEFLLSVFTAALTGLSSMPMQS